VSFLKNRNKNNYLNLPLNKKLKQLHTYTFLVLLSHFFLEICGISKHNYLTLIAGAIPLNSSYLRGYFIQLNIVHDFQHHKVVLGRKESIFITNISKNDNNFV
jgi:hypothetical protein